MVGKAFVAATLLALAVEATELAGNENYAQDARQSLKNSVKKRSGTSFESQSITFSLGDKQYLSPTASHFKSYSVPAQWGLDDFQGQTVPVTVFSVEGEVTCDTLGKSVDTFSQVDDVWDQSFMSSVMLVGTGPFHVASDVAGCVSAWGGNLIIKSGNATSSVSGIGLAEVQPSTVSDPQKGDADVQIPQGPYLAKIDGDVRLTEVYRMYRDGAQAFTTAVIPTTENTFDDLAVPVSGLNTLSIPVPSRLYTYNLPNPRPLEGRRVAVKDLFDMAGLKTGGGSRAYFNTYPARDVTAVAIQKLVDQGAIIVGRAKTSQFANGEDATADWVDQMCPFNPRGDGYQQPSSSSSGPGASIGAYDWLDVTIGSDTGGSITGPATNQGVFGLRPSWGAISLQGAIPLQATQDTAGFFYRDAKAGSEFARGWYGDRFQNYTQFPSTFILPNATWTLPEGYAGADQFAKFRDGLLSTFNPATVDTRDYEDFWNATGQFDKVGASSADYLTDTYADLITYYQWNNFGKQWFEDYAGQNDGRQPFVSPSPLVRWTYAQNNISEAVFNDQLGRKQLYKDFIASEVLIQNNDTCSSSVYVYPIGLGNTSYRNIYAQPTRVPAGFFYTAQFASTPELVVPIGQVPYESTITNHTEYLPISVSFSAAAGCDYLLWDMAVKLQDAGVISSVQAGPLAYALE